MKPIPLIADPNTPIVTLARRHAENGFRLIYHKRRVCLVPMQRKEKPQ